MPFGSSGRAAGTRSARAWLTRARRRRLLHGRRPLDEPRELPAARRTAPLRAQRGRDRHAPRTSARTSAAASSARCCRAATTCSSRPASAHGFSDAQCGFKALRADAARRSLPLVEDDGWFFDTELLLLAERNGMRIHEVPVDWIEDLDSRVDLLPTIGGDLAGLWRMRRAFWRGRGREAARSTGTRRWRHERARPASPATACPRASASPHHARWPRCSPSPPPRLLAKPDAERLREHVLRRRRAQHADELAQLLLRLVRPGRPRLGRQAAARALVPGGEREGVRLLRAFSILLPRRWRASARSGCSTCSSRATSAAWPGSSPRWRSPCRPSPSRSTATTTPMPCSRCSWSLPCTSARAGGRVGPAALARRARPCSIGLAFNTKMLAAMVVVPGHRARLPVLPRLPLARALRCTSPSPAVVLVAVSGAWIAAVDLTPAADRPYVGSTSEQQRAQPRARLQRPRPRDRPERRHVDRRRRAAARSPGRPASSGC